MGATDEPVSASPRTSSGTNWLYAPAGALLGKNAQADVVAERGVAHANVGGQCGDVEDRAEADGCAARLDGCPRHIRRRKTRAAPAAQEGMRRCCWRGGAARKQREAEARHGARMSARVGVDVVDCLQRI